MRRKDANKKELKQKSESKRNKIRLKLQWPRMKNGLRFALCMYILREC